MTMAMRARLAAALAIALPIAALPAQSAAQPAQSAARPAPGPVIGLTQSEEQEARTLHENARRLLEAGKIRELLPVTQRLLALREEEIRRVERVRDRLTNDGKFFEAIPVAERLLALREELLGSEHADTILILRYLAWLYRNVGDYRRAEPLFRRLCDIAEKPGPDRPDLAGALANLAGLYREQQDYERAEPLFLRVLERRGPRDLSALVDLGRLYEEMGDSARAEPLFRRALTVAETLPSYSSSSDPDYVEPENPIIGTALSNLARMYRAQRDPARAEPLFQRALAIAEKANGPDHRSVALVLNNLAVLYQSNGDGPRARAFFSRSLAIRENLQNRSDLALALFNLAHLDRDEGDAESAHGRYARALDLLEKSLGPEHPRLADVLEGITKIHLAKGEIAAALPLQTRAGAIRDSHADLVLAVGSEAQKRKYMAALERSTNAAVSLHAASAPSDADAARLALTTILRRKGRVLDAMTDSLRALRTRLEAGDQALLDELAAITAQLAALVSRGRGGMGAGAYRDVLTRLDRERRRVEADVSERSAEFRAARRPVTIAEVQSVIPEGAALLEIFVYRPLDAKATPGDRWGDPRYIAYVVPRRGEIAWAELGEAAPIDAAVEELRVALADPVKDSRRAARALDAAVFAPVAALLGGARRVLLSPDGALNLVPFGALRDEQGHHRIERYSFTYHTSGRDLLRIAAPAEPRQGALILAAPAFGPIDAPSAPGGSRGLRAIAMAAVRFPPLPGTAQEARAIDVEVGAGARVLLGPDATEAAIKAAHGPRILHAATHGFFLPGDRPDAAPPADPGLAGPGDLPTSRDDGLDPRQGAEALREESPLLRAGLAFAGANARLSGAEDGVLTALEASALDLHGTELIVLSACETGVGEAVRGDGVYGLRRALVIAGAETQVMSLWRVQDEATRDLMVAYYRRLRAGRGRSEAMREVQLAMLARPETAAPYFWAPFIVSGNDAPLYAAAAAPEPARVPPGARGCGCEQPGQRPSAPSAGNALLVAGLLIAWRARGRARRAIP